MSIYHAKKQPTTVIDLTEDTPVVLREGVGDRTFTAADPAC